MFKVMLGIVLFTPFGVSANPKEEFVKAVVEQCQLPKDKAEEMATMGRTGTIVLYLHCVNPQLKIGEDCVLSCKKQSNHIGGYAARIRT